MALLAQLERALDQDEEELEDSPIRQFEIDNDDSKESLDQNDALEKAQVAELEDSFTE